MKTYNITGKKWSMEMKWYDWDDEHRFPHFETVGEDKHFKMKAKSITHAYRKMILLHPSYAVGCCITCEENSDFIADAVFDWYYGLGCRSIFAANLRNFKEANRIIIRDWIKSFQNKKIRSV